MLRYRKENGSSVKALTARSVDHLLDAGHDFRRETPLLRFFKFICWRDEHHNLSVIWFDYIWEMPDFLKPRLLTPKPRWINSTSGQRKNTYSGLNCPFKTESVLKLVRQIFLLPTHRYMFVCSFAWHNRARQLHTPPHVCAWYICYDRGHGADLWIWPTSWPGKWNQVYLRHMLGDSARPAYSTEPEGGSRPLRGLSQHSQRSRVRSHTHYPRLSHMVHLHRDSQRHVKQTGKTLANRYVDTSISAGKKKKCKVNMETEGCVLVCKQTACVKMCLYSEAPCTASENNKLWMNCSYQPCAASHHWRGTSKYHMPNYNQTHHLSQLPQLRLSSLTVVVPAMKSWGRKTQSGILRFPAAAVSQQNTAGIKKKVMPFQLWRFTGVLATEDFVNTPWLD